MDFKQKNKGTLIVRIRKACGDFRMNWMWAKPGKYKIKTQRTLEDFPQDSEKECSPEVYEDRVRWAAEGIARDGKKNE